MKSLLWCLVCSLLAALVICSGALFKAYAASDVWFPNVCGDLRDGMPLTALETILTTQGYSEWDAGSFTGVQITEHCPDMRTVALGQIR